LAIYDTMQYVKPDIATTCVGMAASMGAVLAAGGAPGKRYLLPNARVMIHQPSGGARGQASDIEIEAQEVLRIKDLLCEILARHCKNDKEQIMKDFDRNKWLSAEEAREYGLVDQVMSHKENSK